MPKISKSVVWLSFVSAAIVSISFSDGNDKKTPQQWFPYFDFDAGKFITAPREFGPFTRWWWPGNDVNSEELQREIKMFADNGFAGVEVQPLTVGLNPKAAKEQNDRIYSWDTPSFYEHLLAVMQQAQRSGVTIDMNGGSGWPLGGSFFDPRQSMKTLIVSDTSLKAGETYDSALPKPGNNLPKAQGFMAMTMQKNFVDYQWAKLLGVVAAKVTKKEKKQTILDNASLVDLTDKVKEGKLYWQAPADGEWCIVASWIIPTGEKPSLVASSKTNYVIDHLDPIVVRDAYEYLLGSRTGLQDYYGKPLRAVFNDSYEFHADRIISPDFQKVFKKINGYDITPYLSSVFQQGYNHPTYLAIAYPDAMPPFVFNKNESWRIMYDYDAAVNEVFRNNFIKTSNQWMEEHGMLHRTQAYGFPIDLIGSAASANIPEAEQLFAEGSEGYLKLVTSGAHLNNKPVITQESFVSILRAEMTTPQKIKTWADKSLACGITQFIYHGTPYKYNPVEFGKEGWNPFSSPYQSFINFSTGMNESDPFWKDIKTVNQYLTRCQYALRSGKPKTDVLIYVPFIDFTEDQLAVNPEEILYRGYFEGVEPDIKGFGVFSAPNTAINAWYKKLWPIVNELESKGITWEFVNDGMLQQSKLNGGKLDINGNLYQALILANLPYINLATAKQVNVLSKQGLNIWAVGELPQKQPSYLEYEVNDKLTKQLMEEVVARKSSSRELLLNSIIQTIKFANAANFSRQITREMRDGSNLKFIWNKTDKWQIITFNVDKSFSNSYWLNAENGTIVKNSGTTIFYQLAPYGSVLLYASRKVLAPTLLSAPNVPLIHYQDVLSIEKWNVKLDSITITGTSLFDWRDNEQLKFRSGTGIYAASFKVDKRIPGKKYIIDLGKVYYTASVIINGKNAGSRIFAPYSLDVTQFLRQGDNNIEVQVTTTRLNGFIGEARKGNPMYVQFKNKERTIIPSGLVGPVRLLVRDDQLRN